MRNKILKSFETFVTQPISMLCQKIIHVTNLKTDFTTNKSIDVEVSNSTIQVNVINSQNAYNLLSAVVYKQKMKQLRKEALENKTSEVFNKFSQS